MDQGIDGEAQARELATLLEVARSVGSTLELTPAPPDHPQTN
jgi:hypothetical protein